MAMEVQEIEGNERGPAGRCLMPGGGAGDAGAIQGDDLAVDDGAFHLEVADGLREVAVFRRPVVFRSRANPGAVIVNDHVRAVAVKFDLVRVSTCPRCCSQPGSASEGRRTSNVCAGLRNREAISRNLVPPQRAKGPKSVPPPQRS